MSEATNGIQVEFLHLPVINFAMQQNRVSIIRKFSLENNTIHIIKNICIEIDIEPEFAASIPYHIESVQPGETILIDDFRISLSTGFFAQLTERIAGEFRLKIYSDDVLLLTQNYPIDVLAFDQWGGWTVLPEMLSSFITPNHPAVVPVIQRAAVILEKWTGSPSFDEYQSRNPNRVVKQMAAIYEAIAEQNIVYSSVPPSFEAYGQRVRLVDAVLSQKLGNCLDMSLLYASCLEAIGLHALIIIVNGHAFAGAWLTRETFPDSTIDDISFLTKRTADGINEIMLVETTGMNKGMDMDFDKAVTAADNRLLNPSNFILALDVKRARFSGIRPLPQRVLNGDYWEIKQEDIAEEREPDYTPSSINPYDLSGISQDIQVTKQLIWERKLLDLSLRNSLLNIRMTKNNLQLIPANLDKFEDALSDGEEFQILPRPTDWDNPLFNFGLYHTLHSSDPIIELVRSELTQKRLRSYLTETELQKSLQHIYRSSRLSLEENGANTLYIALGLLKWYETPSSERPRYAPILLLPVEIVRKSAAKGYVIRSREEESMMNITLLEMLRQNFGINIAGLDPLPVDDNGLDVRLIFSIIRKSIKDQRKWDVEEQAILGVFSFNKFIMWNDIHNNAHKLVENKIVSSLMNGKIEWELQSDMVDAATFDKELSPTEIVLPISADSSQMEAIYEAVNDKTYILHGPPGTGKSQTITNIIANALYRGKRVLFVAEKMAALSVVQSRLEAIGLSPFCLELHSNKAKKSSILAQLKATTEVVRTTSPEEYSRQAARLHSLRNELNGYIEALHHKYPFGLSFYDAVTRYLSIDGEEEFTIPQQLIENLSLDDYLEWQDAVEVMVSTGNACGHPHNHPLTGITISNYSAAVKTEAATVLNQFISLLTALKSKIEVVAGILREDATNLTKNQIDTIGKIVRVLLQIPELTSSLLLLPRISEAMEEYRDAVVHGKEKNALKNNILQSYTEDILSINAKQLLAEWNQSSVKWFIPKYFGLRKIKKQLATFSLNGKVTEEKRILHEVIKYQNEEAFVNKHRENFPALFGKYGRRDAEDWEKIDEIIDYVITLNTLLLNYANDIGKSTRLKEALSGQLSEGIVPFKNIYGTSFTELSNILCELTVAEEKLRDVLGISESLIHTEATLQWIDNSIAKSSQWLSNLDKLKDWYQWLLIKDKLEKMNLGFVTRDYSEKNIPTHRVIDMFNKSFYHAVIEYILTNEPKLELFKGKLFNDVIDKYKQLAASFQELTKKELFAKLASNIPPFTQEAVQNSEVGILQRNIKNNGRATPIRKLFDQIPTLLSRMCPCMLMSPISVAQYIDADADKFDLIVFDEASQMPTYEAVGAIARGKNIVIVGDPKQLPPTSFFNVNTIDEDNIDMEDLESILDDCLALSMPSKYLLWHYRSKHESLIAFSNAEYYENKLLTFPSPDNIESKVKLVPVGGYYDKGKTRQNKTEAEAVIKEIERRLSDSVLRKRSIGVVTFSSVQQTLIEDMLSDLFVLRPDLETMALESAEPLFVKNLENVQGDERDIILFSVGYGPDAEGKVSMNFGPLNRVGGERRLNVAVSRARYEMVIFSTLRADQIDLNRTSSVGVAGLKRFLEYAGKGERMPVDKLSSDGNTLLSMQDIIACELRKQGYTVHTNIGSSGYKVDIGIVDRKNPSSYILGLLCDGENYRNTKTVRDREIVQNSVLNMLGWNIMRVWTLDWWENRESVLRAVEKELARLESEPSTPQVLPEVAPQYQNSTAYAEKEEVITTEYVPSPASLKVYSEPYKTALMQGITGQAFDAFLYSDNRNLVISQLKKVISTEAPISKSLLCKRVLSVWNISRLTSRLESYIDTLLETIQAYRTTDSGIVFFWLSEEQCESYDIFRTDSNRDPVDLPPQEVAVAIKQVLEQQISLPVKDLNRLVAQQLGFARGGTNVDAAIQRGMGVAVKKEFLKLEGEKAIYVGF